MGHSELTAAQRVAIAYVRTQARQEQGNARARVLGLLVGAGLTEAAYEHALACIRQDARIVIHFHPDRLGPSAKPAIDALLEEGIYRNQFETGRSSGGLLPFAGSARDAWERQLFGGAYQADGVLPAERPKYGALEVVRWSDGPIPRFGSCYFVLRPHVSARASFTFAGSEDPRAPQRLGTIETLDSVMACLFEEIEGGATASVPWPPFRAAMLGVRDLTIAGFLELAGSLTAPRTSPLDLPLGRVLDSQIEAQIHGPINLREDVALLVADPSFAETVTGATLRRVSDAYRLPLEWHRGFRLRAVDVPDDFRGSMMRPLARRVAGDDGLLDAAAIGAAEASLHQHPEKWCDLGSHTEVLQYLKQLWHVVVHCS